MKRLLSVFVLLFICFSGYSANRLDGTYLTEDYNTKSTDGMIKVTYTFTNDSLYIDAYPTGCGIASMSLEKASQYEYKAVETLYDVNSGYTIRKTIYHLSFFPCVWDKDCLAVYRDGSVVDIIKKID